MRRALPYLLWPFVVVAGTGGTYLGLESGYPLPAVLFAAGAGLLACVLVAEQLIPRRPDWNAFADRQSINDLGHALVANLLGERVGELVFLTLAASAAGGLSALLGGSLWPIASPPLVQIGLAVVIGDGLDYWTHRLLHTVPGLWRIHALHHGITQLHALKAARLHATNLLARFVLVYAPLVVLGAPARVIFWHTSFIGILGVIGHSNTRVRLPSAVHRLVMTPQFHGLHHSIDRALSDSNYANIFPVWDIVFGTFSDPDRHTPGEVGVRDDPIPAGFLAQLLSPLTWPRLVREAASRSAFSHSRFNSSN